MDPEEAMRQIHRAFAEIDELRQHMLTKEDDFEALANAALLLHEHADALREWVGKGGHLLGRNPA